MADGGARRRAGHRGAPGVGEKVEHRDGAAGPPDEIGTEIPVGSLLGEETGMLEIHGLDLEGEVPIADLPLFGDILFLPPAPASRGTSVAGVGPPPQGIVSGGVPDGLGIGTDQDTVPPAFQLFPSATVDQLIILPLVRDPHGVDPPRFLSSKSLDYTIKKKRGQFIPCRGDLPNFEAASTLSPLTTHTAGHKIYQICFSASDTMK